MRTIIRTTTVLALFLLTIGLAAPSFAADDLRGDLVADLDQLQEKLVGLANAVPEDKYSWAPADGVRSVSQSLMHAAGANYFFPTLQGATMPEGTNPRGFEAITEKAKVIETLEDSFDFLKSHIEGLDDAKMTATVNAFGQEMTGAGLLHAALAHLHEHLGQMIAYARSVGVVPPWSAGG